MRRLRSILIPALLAFTAPPAFAATERIPCKSTEAVVAAFGRYVSVRGPGTGVLLDDGQEIHFEGDKRDARAVGGKLVWLDGPVGGSGADPRVAVLEARLAKAKADLAAILAGL